MEQENQSIGYCSNPGKSTGALDQDGISGGGKKWLDSGYILKVELSGYLSG